MTADRLPPFDDRQPAGEPHVPVMPFVLIDKNDQQAFVVDMLDKNEPSVLLFDALDDVFQWQAELEKTLGKTFFHRRSTLEELCPRFLYGKLYIPGSGKWITVLLTSRKERR